MVNKKKITFKSLLIIGLILAVGIQFIPVDFSKPKSKSENDFIAITKPSEETANLLRSACYDCHSNESVYPWYSKIAPVSWFLKSHVNEARKHVNFSEWGTYSEKEKDILLTDCSDEIEDGEMPLFTYTWMHPDARLDEEKTEKLKEIFYEE